MAEVLNVSERKALGKRRIRRLRQAGEIPLVLYGHGAQPANLCVSAKDIEAIVRHGVRLVDLRGAVSESALIHDVQWDVFGAEILHLDLIRVKKDELREITVALELRGEAPGAKQGGMVEQNLHEVTIECPAGSIPQVILVNINELDMGQAIHLRDVPLPEGGRYMSDENAVVVHCVEPTPEIEDEAAAVAEPGEPEVIREKKVDETEAES